MANSYHTLQLDRFGILDESTSPATRVLSEDPTDEAQAEVRQVVEETVDPRQRVYFSGFESNLTLASADVDDLTDGEGYMTSRQGIKLVALVGDLAIQVHKNTLLQASERLNITEPALTRADYTMTREGGSRGSHGITLSRNLLLHLQEEDSNGNLAGGWADTDSDNVPDGYTVDNLKSTDFSGGTFSAFVDTASSASGSISAIIPFPLDGVDVTLSVDFNTLHDDGSTKLLIEALDSDKATVQASNTITVTGTGRSSITLTTPTASGSGATYYLKVYPIHVTGATAETTKFDIQDPCLRIDGGTSYVQK